jgi:DNA-directed RNA polymerase subunit M/transcription elongation factor TFIIS
MPITLEINEEDKQWLAYRFQIVTCIANISKLDSTKSHELETKLYNTILKLTRPPTMYDKMMYQDFIHVFLKSDPQYIQSLSDNFILNFKEPDTKVQKSKRTINSISPLGVSPLKSSKRKLEEPNTKVQQSKRKKQEAEYPNGETPNGETPNGEIELDLKPQLQKLVAQSEYEKTQGKLPDCPRCKTKEFMTFELIQDRSGDEAMSVYPFCDHCKQRVEL